MNGGFGGFLVSATIVGTGLAGIWAWPTLEAGGLQALVSRASDIFQRADSRVRPALAALQSAEGVTGNLAAISESLPPEPTGQIAALQAPANQPVVPAQCEEPEPGQDVAVIGDRVQLRIFEASTLAAADASPVPSDIVFERLDLSGTYEISAAGAVSLPAIGHVDVRGHTLPCIEALVSRAAFDHLRTQNTASAAFALRPPVLVRGAVRTPGAHGYSPGLTVERILAQAGALDDRDAAAQVRLISLESRLDTLNRRQTSLTVERMRIEAALNGHDSLPQDDKTIQAASVLLGRDRIVREQSALAADIAADHLRQARTEATLADLSKRIDSARRQQQVAETQMDYYAKRRKRQVEMLESGYITDARVEETAMRAMDAERVFLEKHDLLFRLESERRMAEHDAELAEAERSRSLTAELRSLSAQADEIDSELDTVLAEMDLFENDGTRLTVTIDRPQDAEGSRRIAAAPGTLVRPGDMVTVSAGSAGDDTDLAGTFNGLAPFRSAEAQ